MTWEFHRPSINNLCLINRIHVYHVIKCVESTLLIFAETMYELCVTLQNKAIKINLEEFAKV